MRDNLNAAGILDKLEEKTEKETLIKDLESAANRRFFAGEGARATFKSQSPGGARRMIRDD